MDIKASVPTEAELVQRARDMIPTLRGRAQACEDARSVPAETIKEFEEAGFFRIVQLREFGGYEMNPVTFYRVLQEIGRGCPSSAWVLMVIGIHNWEVPSFPKQAQVDLYGPSIHVKTSSSYHPWGKAEKVEGGVILDGIWRYSSGCDHCQWALIGAMVATPGAPMPDLRVHLVPVSDYRIQDNWHVFGLAGTGSKDLVLDKVFVPDHRSHSLVDGFHLKGVETLPPFYRMSFGTTFSFAVSSVLVGMAQGAIDCFVEEMKVRTDTLDGNKTNRSPYVKDRLGNALAKVRGAKARRDTAMAAMLEKIDRGESLTVEERVQYKFDAARIGRDCEEAVHMLYKATGARGIMSANPIQRYLRDALAGSNHITQNADDFCGNAGGVALGFETTDLLV